MLTQGDHRRHLFAAGVAAAGLLLGIAGCSDSTPTDPTPARTTTATPRPSSTPAPSAPTPPVLPEQVRTEEGAVAMMRYFFEAYTHAYATGDAVGVSSVSDDQCVFCESVVSNVQANREAGRRVEGGTITARDFRGTAVGDDGLYVVRGQVEEAPATTVDVQNHAVDEDAGGRYEIESTLRFIDGEWRVLELEIRAATAT